MVKIKTWAHFLLFSNIFISVCAASMAAGTYLLLNATVNWIFIVFVFSSTLALYNLPVFIPGNFSSGGSERHQWVFAQKKMLMFICLIAAVISGTLLLFFPIKFMFWFAPVAILSVAYFFPQTQLRGIAVVKTIVVAFVWTCTTAVFPLLLNSGFDRHCFNEPNATILLQNFLFVFPLCLVFNVRDIEADKRVGVRTLPVIYGVKFTIAVCLVFLAVFIALVILSPFLEDAQAGLLLSGLLASFLILYASDKRSDIYYTLWIDGMILVQVILLVCIR